ncbi:MAG: hypothetical protein AB1511_06625 [Deinococcota bacterium]
MNEFTLYTVSLNHFATGEGVLMQVLVVCAQSEYEAVELFWHAFYRGEPLPRTFWPMVQPGVARELLRTWCTADAMDQLDALALASGNLSFSLSCSYNLE